MMNGKLIFRYYTLPANCPIYTYWDGSECKVDMREYCESLTPEYKKIKNNSLIYVYFDGGSNCVIGKRDDPNDIQTVEVDPFSDSNKVRQLMLDSVTLLIIVGFILYMCCSYFGVTCKINSNTTKKCNRWLLKY